MQRWPVVCALLLTTMPASVRAGGLDLRAGAFFPRADSGSAADLFKDDNSLYTRNGRDGVGSRDWRGAFGGAEYSGRLAPNLELGVSIDAYGRMVDTSYRSYVRTNDSEISQSLKLNVVPVGVTLRLIPTARRVRLAPYVAAGVDLVFWQYEEFGDFIDFDNFPRIAYDDFVSSGVAPGAHVAAGLRVRLNHDFSLVGEARYQWATDEMGGDFRRRPGESPLKIDLTGPSATLGLHLRF